MKMKGLKLKKGKEVIDKFMTSHHLTKEEWLKEDKKVFFYQPETDMNYTTIFNFRNPITDFSEYLKEGVEEKDVMESIGSLTIDGIMKDNCKMYKEKGDVVGDQSLISDMTFFYWLKGKGRRLVETYYDEFGSQPSSTLFENNENFVDFFFEVSKDIIGLRFDNSEVGKEIVQDSMEDCDVSKQGTIIDFERGSVISETGISTTELTNLIEEMSLMEKIKKYDYKIGRNDSCPCGSGVKYKKCCLN